jgi:hypothetical protein
MRFILAFCLLLAALPVLAIADPVNPPPSAANVLRWHPAPWQPPAAARGAIRFEPETGEAATSQRAAGLTALRPQAEVDARARAAASVRVAADGSGHAVLGSAFRSYMVVTVDDQGGLAEDCVSSMAKAQAIVDAASKKEARK